MNDDSPLVRLSIIFIAVVVFIVVLKNMASFLRPFVFAILLSFLLIPLTQWCKKRNIPFLLVVIGVPVVLLAIMILLITLLMGDSSAAAVKFSELPLFESLKGTSIMGVNLDQFVNPEKIGAVVSSAVSSALSMGGSFFGEVFLIFLFLIFLLPSYDIIIKNISRRLSKPQAKKFKSAIVSTQEAIIGYLWTKFVVSLGTGFVSLLFLLLFGSKFPVLLAFIIFVLNFIPNIGSFMAVALALVVYLVTYGFVWQIIVLAALLIATQVLFGNIIEPKFQGRQLELSPIIILLSLFFWGWIWGVPGMILSVPLTSVIKITMEHVTATKKIAKFMA